ncbi:hypothetical protein DPEC_G00210720 [Dallia pectoralis]|uniref:Uncharacterized protein n=1 Tax=Dallia pectoralis TaxID=75939 RepID=A0ACC2G695_DALPE|nr:hypothetical protein DPEC_G00210720 [Dallia pectoralis]
MSGEPNPYSGLSLSLFPSPPPSPAPCLSIYLSPVVIPTPCRCNWGTGTLIVLLFFALALLHPLQSHLPPAQDMKLDQAAFILLPQGRPLHPLSCHCGMADTQAPRATEQRLLLSPLPSLFTSRSRGANI